MPRLDLDVEKQSPRTVTTVEGQKEPDMVAGPVWPVEQRRKAVADFDRSTEGIDHSKSKGPVTAKHPKEHEFLHNAIVLIKNGEPALAQNLLREVLRHNSHHTKAILWMGRSHRALRQNEQAERCFSNLVEELKDTDAMFDMADLYYELGRDADASCLYSELLERLELEGEKHFSIYKNIGNIHVRAGDYEAAEENYNRAFTLNPDSDTLLVNYGTLEIQKGNLEKALERFRHALAINHDNDRGWVGLALIHRQYGDFDLAWANIDRALDINPQNETALGLAMDWATKDGREGHMISRLEDYLAKNGTDVNMSLAMARLLYRAGRLQQALLELERMLALDPTVPGGEALMKAIREEYAKQTEKVPCSNA